MIYISKYTYISVYLPYIYVYLLISPYRVFDNYWSEQVCGAIFILGEIDAELALRKRFPPQLLVWLTKLLDLGGSTKLWE